MVAVKKDKINGDALGTGRRKSSVARVRVRPGSGTVKINNRPLDEYFPNIQDQKAVIEALDISGRRDSVDVVIRVHGGGSTGQSGACRMGIARALVSYDSELFGPLRDGGFLTRDARMKERKKYGLHGARRGTQFSKR
jgi:small subunit ribosomal protein S9